MNLRDVSIRGKLLILGVVTSAVALLLSSVVLLVSSYVILRADVRRDIEAQASIVADNTTAALKFSDAEAASETLQTLRVLPSVDLACLFNGGPALVAQFSAPLNHTPCPLQPPADGVSESLSAIVVARPVVFRGERVGTVYFLAHLSEVWKRLRSELWTVLVAFVAGSVGALLIALRLGQVIARPVMALSSTASEISSRNDYSLRATKEGQDEIGTLVETFNDMVSQVERRAEDLRAANRLKDDFLATLSHELRTPLNAMVGWLQLLRMKPNDPVMAERALASLERNTKIQVRLIEDLLDVSSIASGKLRLSFEPVDLATILQMAIDVVRPTADAKSVSLLGAADTSPHLVVGDAARLEQVVWNLLSNAIKFTAPGGHVNITIDTVGDEHRIRVADDGIGIESEFLPHVFDRFRQADGSRTRRHGGLGVGLAIARELTERHGGRVVAESPGIGQGATFSMFLPKARQEAIKNPSPAVDSVRRLPLVGLRILVIDDEAESGELAKAALASAGASVSVTTGAEPAIAALADRTFDVLVCDIAMPETDGYQLLRLIRNSPNARTAHTPAVAATAHADDESRIQAAQAGFQAFVVKPFTFETLVTTVLAASRPAKS